MYTYFCYEHAKSTAYTRYGKTITRIKHRAVFIDGIGTCEAIGTMQSPDMTTVPAKSSKRFFSTNYGNLRKHYFCPEHVAVVNPTGYFKTKGEALAALVSITLLGDSDE